jgi:cytochrome c peroxidase
VTRYIAVALLLFFSGASWAQVLDFSESETRAILRHGPWPSPWSPDPSNGVSGNPQAMEFGERLFFEPRLSPSGKLLCATCHAPFRGWQDARARAFGLAETDRNTQSLFDVRHNRWFGWTAPAIRCGRRASVRSSRHAKWAAARPRPRR